jgi:hypothetical protein
MRLTPLQFETSYTHNLVWAAEAEPFLGVNLPLFVWGPYPEGPRVLGKGPKFMSEARSLSTTKVLGACAKLKYRMLWYSSIFFLSDVIIINGETRNDGRYEFNCGPLCNAH